MPEFFWICITDWWSGRWRRRSRATFWLSSCSASEFRLYRWWVSIIWFGHWARHSTVIKMNPLLSLEFL